MVRSLFVVCAVFYLVGMTSTPAASQGEWVNTGSPIASLASGAELIVSADGVPFLFGLAAGGVQRYHSNTGEWSGSGALQVRRASGATVTLLPSGLVLIAGGVLGDGSGPTSSNRGVAGRW
jgi:hypothetical protein